MSDPGLLKQAAQAVLGVDVLAAGVFGLADNYAVITAAGAAAAVVAGPPGAPAVDGLVGAAAVHVAREAVAQGQGLAVRMLVAVCQDAIVLLDWDGAAPGRVLLTFERATTQVTVTRFGASRRVHLLDSVSGVQVEVTGSTGFLSSEASADKTVLELLA